MSDATTEKILDLVAATKKLPREKVTIDSTFEELGLDSLDAINLVFEIEGEFNISVPDEAVRSVHSVRDLLDKLKTVLNTETKPSATPNPAAPE